MRKHKRHLVLGATLLMCLLSMLLGWLAWSPAPAVAGGLGLCYLGFRLVSLKREERRAVA
jgi:protein-S-isoprenylcysteine O-methyltransferase Ste14